jgi:hypothetical protein
LDLRNLPRVPEVLCSDKCIVAGGAMSILRADSRAGSSSHQEHHAIRNGMNRGKFTRSCYDFYTSLNFILHNLWTAFILRGSI